MPLLLSAQPNGWAALHLAILNKRMDAIEMLIGHKADVNKIATPIDGSEKVERGRCD